MNKFNLNAIKWVNRSNRNISEELGCSPETVRTIRNSHNFPKFAGTKPAIIDQFTNLVVSRQRKYQLRNINEGKCCICGNPLANKSHCQFHAEMANAATKRFQAKIQTSK
jgi:hypothetical protein